MNIPPNLTLPSIDTLILSLVIGAVGWGIKEGTKAAVLKLIEFLRVTIVKVELLDEKITQVIKAIGEVDRLKNDLNLYYARLRNLENRINDDAQ